MLNGDDELLSGLTLPFKTVLCGRHERCGVRVTNVAEQDVYKRQVLMWANTETLTWKMVLTYYVTGFPLDCVHAAATAFFLWIAAEPMLEKLDRIKLKYGLME